MAKQGMNHSESNKTKSAAVVVPEIQGKAHTGKSRANPIIANTKPPAQKVFHTKPFSQEKPISYAYAVIDNDLARDNVENDLTAADLQDL